MSLDADDTGSAALEGRQTGQLVECREGGVSSLQWETPRSRRGVTTSTRPGLPAMRTKAHCSGWTEVRTKRVFSESARCALVPTSAATSALTNHYQGGAAPEFDGDLLNWTT